MDQSELAAMFDREPLANWNGETMPLSEVRVSVLDRAFLFGDAIYEVIRLYHGKPFLFDEHIARLEKNLRKLTLAADASKIASRVMQTIAASGVQNGVVYIQVTRGVAPRTHRYPSPSVSTNQLIYVAEFNDPYQQLRQTGACVITTADLRWKRCDIKSVNLLPNCMAAQAAHEADCPEALLVNEAGQLVEGTRTSLFGVADGTILTAPLGDSILPGITRKLLMRLAQECSVPMEETLLYRDQLSSIDELFLTGTTTEILPIVKVDDDIIGSGSVGPVVRQLLAAYRKTIQHFES